MFVNIYLRVGFFSCPESRMQCQTSLSIAEREQIMQRKHLALTFSSLTEREANPVGTFGQYFKSRYDTLKYCGFVIYD